MPSSPGYKRDYAHEDAIRNAKPGEREKNRQRHRDRASAVKHGLISAHSKKQVDHIVPLSHGGAGIPSNIRIISAHLNESYPRTHTGALKHQNPHLKG